MAFAGRIFSEDPFVKGSKGVSPDKRFGIVAIIPTHIPLSPKSSHMNCPVICAKKDMLVLV
jgi:hypothetical protein